jgi:hypothetical protein
MSQPAPGAFKESDLIAVREGAIKAFVAISGRCRLPGMVKDLTADDRRVLAFVIAAMQHLIRLGVVTAEQAEPLFPETFTLTQEPLDEQMYVHGSERAKKK